MQRTLDAFNGKNVELRKTVSRQILRNQPG